MIERLTGFAQCMVTVRAMIGRVQNRLFKERLRHPNSPRFGMSCCPLGLSSTCIEKGNATSIRLKPRLLTKLLITAIPRGGLGCYAT